MTCLSALLLSSCIRETIVDYPCHDAVLSFTISNSDDTRAGGDGESKGTNDNDYNEDAIKTVDIFLYKSEGYGDNVPAVKHVSATVPAGSKESCEVKASLNNDELDALGLTDDGKSCKAYIVVNFSDIATKAKSTSYNDLTAAVIDSDFSKRQQFSTDIPAGDPLPDKYNTIKLVSVMPQESFVMDSAVETLTFSNNKLTSNGSVLVTRVAAKIRLTVSLADKVFTGPQGDGGLIWTPTFEGMTLSFHNGVNSATVAGGEAKNTEGNINFFNVTGIQFDSYSSGNGFTPIPGEYTDDGDASGSSYIPAPRATRAGADTRASITNITHVTPFYTYPSSWTSDLGEGAARFELKVSWGSVANKDEYYNTNGEYLNPSFIGNPTEWVPYRYSIPINMAEKKIERNKYYHITISIGVLGNLDYFNPNEYSYYVTDWNSESVEVNLQKPKYLTVEKDEVHIYNQSSVDVGYRSSDPVTIVIDKIEYETYKFPTTRTITITKESTTLSESDQSDKVLKDYNIADKYDDYSVKSANVVDTSGDIRFNHTMLANTFTIHKIYVTIYHTNNPDISQNVVIYQYPPIYIKSDHSNGVVFVNGSKNSDKQTNVYSDGSAYNRIGLGCLADKSSISGDDDGTNVNRNMYNIYVTSLDVNSSYVIGDPREVNGATNNYITELTSYRATRKDATNIIAPIYKYASSYGKTTSMDYNGAVARCASYQEDGYPAGRWRIPTPAEVEFVQQRCLNKDIPSLFNGSSSNNRRQAYWVADGRVYWPGYGTNMNSTMTPDPGFYQPGSNNMATSHAVRCVYDVWYWGESNVNSALETVKWGDAKTNDQLL